jgi:2,3-bisphosphoglycerate-independent phosphoglycerate mutase
MNKTIKKGDKILPMILIVLDGWGIDKPNPGNAISLAKTPFIEKLGREYPSTELYAHGKYVGLPAKQVGNSEAGHMNIGAGRLVLQDSVKISKSIKEGTFFKNSAFLGAIRHVRKMNSKMHVMGMLSNGQSPHSDPEHLLALLNLLKKNKVNEVYLHLFTDGRDSPQYASLQLIDELEENFLNNEKISTIMGRFYAMDRKKKWERTKKAYETLVLGRGRTAGSAQAAITESYNRGDSDEFVEPCLIGKDKGKGSRIEDGDSVIFFNLRSDRSRQMAKVFVQSDFNSMNPNSFVRAKQLKHLYFVAMTDFGPDLDDILTAYPGVDIKETLPTQLADLSQLYIAETEKYAHVTYFLNGGYSGKVANEEQLMIPSPDVKSYDQIPAMSSRALADKVIANLAGGKIKYDFTFINFAAPDMIGHTGNLKAAVECCEKVDKCVADITNEYLRLNGTVIITADHGNIEKMINLKTGEIHTEHTTNQVPFILVNSSLKNIKLKNRGILGDVAPTVLKLLNKKIPKEISGKALF